MTSTTTSHLNGIENYPSSLCNINIIKVHTLKLIGQFFAIIPEASPSMSTMRTTECKSFTLTNLWPSHTTHHLCNQIQYQWWVDLMNWISQSQSYISLQDESMSHSKKNLFWNQVFITDIWVRSQKIHQLNYDHQFQTNATWGIPTWALSFPISTIKSLGRILFNWRS